MFNRPRIFVAHPDDCIIFFWHLISSIQLNWEIVYLTYSPDDPRAIEISKFWDKHNVSTKFLGFYDNPYDLKSNISSIDTVSLSSKLVDLVESSDLVCTHSSRGEYGHPHHIQLHNAVLNIGHSKILTTSDSNSTSTILLSGPARVDLTRIPLHRNAVEHYMNAHDTFNHSFYKLNFNFEELLTKETFALHLSNVTNQLETSNSKPHIYKFVKNFLRKLRSSLLYKSFAHLERRSMLYLSARRCLNISAALNAAVVSAFDWALIEKSSGNYRISEKILLRIFTSSLNTAHLTELVDCASNRLDTLLLYHLIRKCVALNIHQNSRITRIISKHSIFSPVCSQQLTEVEHEDFLGRKINPDSLRSVKKFGELANFHNYLLKNNHIILDDLFIDYTQQQSVKKNRKKLFTFWDTSPAPSAVIANVNSWRNYSNDQTLLFNAYHSSEYIRNAIGADAAALFLKLPHPAAQSDFFRLAKLYNEGGVYVDADERMITTLSVLFNLIDSLRLERFFVCDTAAKQAYIQNHFIFCKYPKDPVIENALINSIQNLKTKEIASGHDIWKLTGPGCITRSYLNCIGNPKIIDSTGFITSTAFRKFFTNPPANFPYWNNWRTFKR